MPSPARHPAKNGHPRIADGDMTREIWSGKHGPGKHGLWKSGSPDGKKHAVTGGSRGRENGRENRDRPPRAIDHAGCRPSP
ncbi:hypothetical protein CFR71_11520 [Novacetimonas pomaceti]|uniref:Uncharacterized protein n=2 Tax=Novacetimonas pomaceti TaxID=2021998 RepID=A0A318Q5Z9_9PROT|nr:hypothetical protein CFR71_11520 [Novacetimonas pomaceti]